MKPADELQTAYLVDDGLGASVKKTRALLDECEAVTNAVVYGAAPREGDTYLISGATWRAARATLAKLRGKA